LPGFPDAHIVTVEVERARQADGTAEDRWRPVVSRILTQTDLAALVGASRVRVNQALGVLRKRNASSVGSDGGITILDADALARRAR
jgi:hypothetical protein